MWDKPIRVMRGDDALTVLRVVPIPATEYAAETYLVQVSESPIFIVFYADGSSVVGDYTVKLAEPYIQLSNGTIWPIVRIFVTNHSSFKILFYEAVNVVWAIGYCEDKFWSATGNSLSGIDLTRFKDATAYLGDGKGEYVR